MFFSRLRKSYAALESLVHRVGDRVHNLQAEVCILDNAVRNLRDEKRCASNVYVNVPVLSGTCPSAKLPPKQVPLNEYLRVLAEEAGVEAVYRDGYLTLHVKEDT